MSAASLPAPSTPVVMVCGSLNVDTFVRVDRFPTAGETTIASPNGKALGGKGANQAVAAARYLDGTVIFQATVGMDADGDAALTTLTDYGVDVSAVDRAPQDVPTGQAFIMNDPDGENIIVVTSGANEYTVPATQDDTGDTAAAVLLAQGELTPEHSAALPGLAQRLGARFVLNLAPVTTRAPDLLAAADPLVLNESEAAEVFGTASDATAVADAAVAAVDAGVATSVLITLGAQGAVLVAPEGRTDISPLPADNVVDTTGAGDAFCGTLAAALAEGEDLVTAAHLASAAGSLAVRGRGAAPSYAGRDEVRGLL
ncbi:ribokinase [Corynebacterium sp. CNJ-954]|uniref:ribokinase n=1 Tax=Corynebacterium sp. CNJ-954 TaxID=1904962 RepID=UPI0009633AB5|nr:ribokinase [Corynebacterium sp. CNJ-954]OLT55687.1 ribokinase [Corynebacterium sp. CNJ-954]